MPGTAVADTRIAPFRSTAPGRPAVQSGVLFRDDFKRAPFASGAPPGWTLIDGSWDGIVDDGRHVLRHGQGAYGHVATGSADWTNYTASADIKPTALATGFAGLAARFQGPGDYYACGFYYATTVRLWRMRGYVMKLLDGRRTAVDTTRFHTVKLSVMGDRLSCLIDGTWLLGWTDGTLMSGRLALLASDQETAEFDHVEALS
jgi:hypothetical protein